ncbi:MAG: hypothetical protein LC713_07180 [Actinobacteria bacterium]|nr:hypothetical protein [Actinomycetota bacterium]
MQPFSTHLFRFAAPSSPALVWSALTDRQSGRLYGMSLTTTCEPEKWEPDAALQLSLTEDPARYQLLFQRTITGFDPSEESHTVALQVIERTRERLAEVA